MIETRFTRSDIGPHSLFDYEAPLGEYLGAKVDEALVRNPVASIERMSELDEAQRGPTEYFTDFDGEIVVEGKGKPDSPYVGLDEANRIGTEYGLKFDTPPTKRALGILIARKQAEIHRASIIERSNVGVGGAALGFLAELAATSVDPINIASAFVPVVGQGRYALWAARYGKTTARGLRGGIEGVVGAALVEPIVLAGALSEQADYDAYDSFMNLVFGGALGGGLHIAGGKAVDIVKAIREGRLGDIEARIEAAAPETHRAALVAVLDDLNAGRRPDAEAILSLDPGYRSGGTTPDEALSTKQAAEAGLDQATDPKVGFSVPDKVKIGDLVAKIDPETNKARPGEVATVRKDGIEVRDLITEKKTRLPLDEFKRDYRTVSPKAARSVRTAADEVAAAGRIADQSRRLNTETPPLRDAQSEMRSALRGRVAAANDIRNASLADFETAERARAKIEGRDTKPNQPKTFREHVDADVQDIEAGLDGQAVQNPEHADLVAEVKQEAADLLKEAEQKASAIEALAMCMARG